MNIHIVVTIILSSDILKLYTLGIDVDILGVDILTFDILGLTLWTEPKNLLIAKTF